MERQVGIASANDMEDFNLQLLGAMGWEMWDKSRTGGHGICVSVVDGRDYFYTWSWQIVLP